MSVKSEHLYLQVFFYYYTYTYGIYFKIEIEIKLLKLKRNTVLFKYTNKINEKHSFCDSYREDFFSMYILTEISLKKKMLNVIFKIS